MMTGRHLGAALVLRDKVLLLQIRAANSREERLCIRK
jgi:hypothetical protein